MQLCSIVHWSVNFCIRTSKAPPVIFSTISTITTNHAICGCAMSHQCACHKIQKQSCASLSAFKFLKLWSWHQCQKEPIISMQQVYMRSPLYLLAQWRGALWEEERWTDEWSIVKEKAQWGRTMFLSPNRCNSAITALLEKFAGLRVVKLCTTATFLLNFYLWVV